METQEKIFVEVESANLWLPKDTGDQIEGEVTQIGQNQFEKQQVTLKVPAGTEFAIPSYAVLNNKLSDAKVGDYYRITFEGDVKGQKGVMYKSFKVEKAKA